MVKNITFILLGSAALSLGGCDAFNDEYSKEWEKDFTAACVDESITLGEPEDISKQLCACVSADLFTKLDGVAEQADPPEEKVNASVDKCVEEFSAAQ